MYIAVLMYIPPSYLSKGIMLQNTRLPPTCLHAETSPSQFLWSQDLPNPFSQCRYLHDNTNLDAAARDSLVLLLLWLLYVHLLLWLRSRITIVLLLLRPAILHLLLPTILLLLRPTVLLLLLLAASKRSLRIGSTTILRPTAHWVRGFVIRLSVILVLWLMLLLVVVGRHLRRRTSTLQVYVHTALVSLGIVL